MAQFFYSVIMAIYVLYLTRELGLSAASVGLIFGLGGGVGVLVGSAAAASVARLFGPGRTLVLAHLLFGVFGMFLAFTVVWRTYAALLVFVSEFAQLSVNAVYMVNRSSVEQAVTPPGLRGRVPSESDCGPCGFGHARDPAGWRPRRAIWDECRDRCWSGRRIVFVRVAVVVARPSPGCVSGPRIVASEARRGGAHLRDRWRTMGD
jgi:hypothetical protein